MMNHHFKEKKNQTILILFSIVFDNCSVPILSDFVKYFGSQFLFFLITNHKLAANFLIEGLNKVNREP